MTRHFSAPLTTLLAFVLVAPTLRAAAAGEEIDVRHGAEAVTYEVADDEVQTAAPDGQRRRESLPATTTRAQRQQAALAARGELVLYPRGETRTALNRAVVSGRILVTLAPGALPPALPGVTTTPAPHLPGSVILTAHNPAATLDLVRTLRTDPAVTSAEPLLGRKRVPRSVTLPDDTYFTQQWHLKNTGQKGGIAGNDVNVTNAWAIYRGNNVTLAIVDDGVQSAHEDISPNYVASLGWDFNNNDSNPAADIAAGDKHGHACAGLAAARGDNNKGICGVAWQADLVALRLIGASGSVTVDDSVEAEAMTWNNSLIDIKSNSWGPGDTGTLMGDSGPLWQAAVRAATTNGRGGRGEIICWAGGNGRATNDNSNYDSYANSIYVIAVGACDDRGTNTWYSEPGANLLVCAPSSNTNGSMAIRQSITTTDLIGPSGYNIFGTPPQPLNDDYTSTFGGTSASTPLVAGVCALLLEANPNLGWRDVKEILIRSATKNHSTSSEWTNNPAGFHFHHDYGAGIVNASAAVALAAGWTNLGPMLALTNSASGGSSSLPDNNTSGVTRSLTLTNTLRVEHVTVTVGITHPRRGQLDIRLTSPSGMESRLHAVHSDNSAYPTAWTYSSVRHWGETSGGTWTLRVSDRVSGTTGSLTGATLTVYGSALNPDTDSDGMPDAWEIQYGLNPNVGTDAAQDLDGDGQSNLAEYRAGTVPTQSTSFLRFLGTARTGNVTFLTFPTVTGKNYRLQGSHDLALPWTNLGGPLSGTGTNLTVPITNTAPRYFHRAILVP